MDIEQILAPYRGENVALQIDNQQDWDVIIPHLRQKSNVKFNEEEFETYSPIYLFLKDKENEMFGSKKSLNDNKIIKFSDLKPKLYECW